jgi:hypothetical protein
MQQKSIRHWLYRIPVAVQFCYALLLIVGMLYLPEKPRYLIMQGRINDAAQSLSLLRRLPADNPSVQQKLAEREAHYKYKVTLGSSSYVACFQEPVRKRLFTGVNFIFYYRMAYFSNSGLENPFLVSVITSVVNICSKAPDCGWLRHGAAEISFCLGQLGWP